MLAEPKPGDGSRLGGSRMVEFRMADTPSYAMLTGHEGILAPCALLESSNDFMRGMKQKRGVTHWSFCG